MTFPFCLLLLLLFGAAEAAEKCTFDVQATAETPKLREEGDRPPDADDAAVWTNGTHALIVGTLKEGGLATFLPDGSQKERISLPPPSSGNKPARFNNVVVLDGLVVVTDRGQDILRFYTVTANLTLEEKTLAGKKWVFSKTQDEVNKQHTVYGLGGYVKDGRRFAVATRRAESKAAKVEIIKEGDAYTHTDPVIISIGHPNYTTSSGETWTPCVEDVSETPQSEGVVMDVVNNIMMISVETVGLFKAALDDTKVVEMLDKTQYFGANYTLKKEIDEGEIEYECEYGAATSDAGNIHADAEGIALYDGEGAGFYVLSSQDGNRYELYSRLPPHSHLGSFRIFKGADQAEETDGVEIVSTPFPGYPHGMLVVQDEGKDPDDVSVTNFKFVNMSDVLAKFNECYPTTPAPPSAAGTCVTALLLVAVLAILSIL